MMEKNISLKERFVKSVSKIIFCLSSLLFFFCVYIAYSNWEIDSFIDNSYHGILLVCNESKIKLNISFYKKEKIAYLRLVQGEGADAHYINAEIKIDDLLSHSMVQTKISSHEKRLLDKLTEINYTKKLVSAMLYVRNGKLILILNRDDFYIKADKCDIKEMVFILMQDR